MSDPWIPGNITGANQVFRAVPGTYGGYSLRETSGTNPATLVLWDHATAAAGTIIEQITVPAGEAATVTHDRGVRCLNGIYVQVVTGTVVGTLRTN